MVLKGGGFKGSEIITGLPLVQLSGNILLKNIEYEMDFPKDNS
jgi:hypothetical protein